MESQQNRRDEGKGTSDFLIDGRIKRIGFGDEAVRKAFLELKTGKFEEKLLVSYMEKAMDRLLMRSPAFLRVLPLALAGPT